MKKLLLLSIFLTLFLSLLTGVQTVNANEQKWYQPPDMRTGVNLMSIVLEPVDLPESVIVADDWMCRDPRPVTDVHFWGSFIGWQRSQSAPDTTFPPPVIDSFIIRIYEDIPAGTDLDYPYSRPGERLYKQEVKIFQQEYLASIPLPDGTYEHKFIYNLDLPVPFVQVEGTVYWISIAAVMPLEFEFPWGWETSEEHWNDNACRLWLHNNYWEEITPFLLPPWYPEFHQRVDMAFALTVGEPTPPPLPEPIKWCQLPDMERGINLISHPGPDMPTVADDWLCLDGSPVSDLHFWGSYPGWYVNDPEPLAPTPGVKGFRIQIYSDRPAMADGDDFSRPDKLLYEVWVDNFRETFVASIPVDRITYVEFEHKYRYDLDLPRIFWQERNQVYWLNIAALPADPPPGAIEFLWGWENSQERWNDCAVRGWYEDVFTWFWDPIIDPYNRERYLDMAFALTTCPGPAKWLQLPDMAHGRNIISQAENPVVADDFLCTNGKPILEVGFWGSYLTREGVHWEKFDSSPSSQSEPPPIEAFKISFHEDIPAGVDPEMPWSHPGEPSTEDQWIDNYEMRYWDSIPHYDESGNRWWEHKYYYKVQLRELFFQEEGRIYWLDIGAQMAPPVDPEIPWFWGWETSKDHWNDVAVKGDGFWWDPLGLVGTICFEDLPLGMPYHVGDTFVTSGNSCSLQPFQWSNLIWTSAGVARIDNTGQAGGLGQELAVNNINVALDLKCPIYELRLLFGEYGGNVNLRVNGDFRNEANFQVLNGLTVGNVLVSVTGTTPGLGTLKLDGLITDFAIGGQELWIDEIGGRGGCDMAFMLITEESLDYCEGDFYRDGDADGGDLSILCQDYNRSDCNNTGDCEGDFNYDGRVIYNDLAVFAVDFGRFDCPCNMLILPR